MGYRKSKKTRQRGLSKIQKAQVKDMCLATGETKSKEFTENEKPITSYDTLPLSIPLLEITKGSSSNQRIGVQLRLTGIHQRKLFHSYNFTDTTGAVVSKSGIVRECILRGKNLANEIDYYPQFFIKNGNAIAYGDTTEKEKYYLPLNTRAFDIIYERTHKIARKGNANASENYDSNKLVKAWTKQDKVIKYQTNTPPAGEDEAPNYNYFYFCWLMATDMDTVSSDTKAGVELSSSIRVFYKDA